MPRTSPFIITLSSMEERILVENSRKYTASYAKVVRAKIVLFAAAGMANVQISELVDLPLRIVTKWRKRFYYERLDGLEDQPRCGRPRSFSPSEHCGD
jgi:transposase